MALKGTITGSTANQFIDCKIVWSATQSIAGNYSDVTATLYYSRNNTGYTTQGTWNGKIIINGVETSSTKYITITKDSNTVAMTATTRVYHDSNGAKSIVISASGYMSDTTLTSTTCSATVTLDTIIRASSVSLSSTSVNVLESITATITSASTSFTHKVEFYINSSYQQTYTNVGTSQAFTIPSGWANFMSSTPSCTAYCSVTTYNGSTQIGEKVTIPFTVTIPDTTVPALGDVTLQLTDHNVLLQNKNEITVSASGCRAGAGTSIRSYTFDVLSSSTVIATSSITSSSGSASATFGPFAQTGDLKFRVTVTDNRDRSSSNTGNEKTQTCYAYNAPYFTSFTAYRCDSSGNAKSDGTYIKYNYGTMASEAGTTNITTVKIYYKLSTATTWTQAGNVSTTSGIIKTTSNTNANFNQSNTYMVYAEVTDSYGESSNSAQVTIFGQSRIFNVRPNGTGIAFGKMAESDNLFETVWPAKFNSTVSCSSVTCEDDVSCDSLTCNNINGKSIVDLIYPVGSIYMSVNSTSPATLFGGTWEQLQDRFLLSAGNTYTAGSTGGSADVTLNLNQIPSHAHMEYLNCTYGGGNKTISSQFIIEDMQYVSWTSAERTGMNTGYAGNTGTAGGSQPHDNMPPYLAVYMWKRTA